MEQAKLVSPKRGSTLYDRGHVYIHVNLCTCHVIFEDRPLKKGKKRPKLFWPTA